MGWDSYDPSLNHPFETYTGMEGRCMHCELRSVASVHQAPWAAPLPPTPPCNCPGNLCVKQRNFQAPPGTYCEDEKKPSVGSVVHHPAPPAEPGSGGLAIVRESAETLGAYKVAWREGSLQGGANYEVHIPTGSRWPRPAAIAMAEGLEEAGFRNVRVVRTDTVVEVIRP